MASTPPPNSTVTLPAELLEDVAAHPDRYRPATQQDAEVLVLAGERAGTVGRAIGGDLGRVAVDLDWPVGGWLEDAPAWALVGSVDGGPRPDIGDRVLVLATREIDEDAPFAARIVPGGDGGTLQVDAGDAWFSGVTRWALLPAAPDTEPDDGVHTIPDECTGTCQHASPPTPLDRTSRLHATPIGRRREPSPGDTWTATSGGSAPPALRETRYGGVDEDPCTQPLGSGVQLGPAPTGDDVEVDHQDEFGEDHIGPLADCPVCNAPPVDWDAREAAAARQQLAAGRSHHYTPPHFEHQHWAMRGHRARPSRWAVAGHAAWMLICAAIFGAVFGLALTAGGRAMADRPGLAWAVIGITGAALVVGEVLPLVRARWRRDDDLDDPEDAL